MASEKYHLHMVLA